MNSSRAEPNRDDLSQPGEVVVWLKFHRNEHNICVYVQHEHQCLCLHLHVILALYLFQRHRHQRVDLPSSPTARLLYRLSLYTLSCTSYPQRPTIK